MNNYDPKTKARIVDELRALGITHVIVEYSGSGDSGSVHEVSAILPGGNVDDYEARQDITELEASKPESDQIILLRIRDRLLGAAVKPLHARIESLCYAALDAVNADDWCNNDGGGGTMTIYVEDNNELTGEHVCAGTIKIAHYYNETIAHESSYELL